MILMVTTIKYSYDLIHWTRSGPFRYTRHCNNCPSRTQRVLQACVCAVPYVAFGMQTQVLTQARP